MEPKKAIKTRTAIDWNEVRSRLALAAKGLESGQRYTPQQTQDVLLERARRLARAPAAAPTGELSTAMVFALGDERYAVELAFVREVVRCSTWAVVPHAPKHLVGLANLRGELQAVFDLLALSGLKTQASGDAARVVVLGRDQPEFGLVVDAVGHVVVVDREKLLPIPEAQGLSRECVLGLTREGLIVLDGGALIADRRFFIEQNEFSGG